MFAFQSMTREKSRGNIESLMATPLSVKNIWIAKSLAVFIPGMVLGEILTLAALLAVNYIYFVPKMGFIYSHWIGLSSFLAVPLIYLCLKPPCTPYRADRQTGHRQYCRPDISANCPYIDD